MNDPVTFGTLRRFLEDLGFVMTTVPGSSHVAEHPSGCLLVFPPYQEADKVRPIKLVTVRRFLDEYRLVEREEFDGLLRQRSLAS